MTMHPIPGRATPPGGGPGQDVVGLLVRVVVTAVALGVVFAFVVGVAAVGLAILGVLVAIVIVATVGRRLSARLRLRELRRRGGRIRSEDRIDPTSGQVRRTTVIDID